MGMFCNQCQEAAKGIGCTINGVCGKNEDLSGLQHSLLNVIQGIAWCELKMPENKRVYGDYIIRNIFTTITNANYDDAYFYQAIKEGTEIISGLFSELNDAAKINIPAVVQWKPTSDKDIQAYAERFSTRMEGNEDAVALKELVLYGVKGMAAYTEHAMNLEHRNEAIIDFVRKAMVKILDASATVDELLALVMETGKFGVEAMALLDKANTETYGHPEITKVNIGVRKNPGILISGHDLKDLSDLLDQTEGTGVDVYTHSEMLPAHYYPKFKKYAHFAGNYGNSWWMQKEEFETFNGPILFTTNCIVPPSKSATYTNRVYTTGSSGFPGCTHISARKKDGSKDFSVIIEHAKKTQSPIEIESGEIIGGFAHNQVIALADKVLDAVNKGKIKKFIVMAGCDGRVKSRSYYTEFAEALPKDTVILTAGCAKYRYNKLPLGDIDGIPRLLDAGQCNDSYSLAVIALKLKEVLGLKDINELPISYNIAWYEQKAVIVLLALLYLGVKDIHLGPTLPAFLSPGVAKVLTESFGLKGISTVEQDMAELLS